jgi:hypothetical protein
MIYYAQATAYVHLNECPANHNLRPEFLSQIRRPRQVKLSGVFEGARRKSSTKAVKTGRSAPNFDALSPEKLHSDITLRAEFGRSS